MVDPSPALKEAGTWLGPVEAAVDSAVRRLIKGASPKWSDWEVTTALDDLLQLEKQGDCSYDQPSIGALYASWYHVRRTQDLIRILAPMMFCKQENYRVCDLGTGTGATVWAVGLLLAAGKKVGLPIPDRCEVVSYDTSPFMVNAARVLHEELMSLGIMDSLEHDDFRVEFKTESWVGAEYENPLDVVIAGYLFDVSDHARGQEIGDGLIRLSRSSNAKRIVILTSRAKATIAADALSPLREDDNWMLKKGELLPWLWEGPLSTLQKTRQEWLSGCGVRKGLFFYSPKSLEAMQIDVLVAENLISVQLEMVPEPRRRVLLSAEQEEAAEPDGRLTLIIGAAGSGKSWVLAERIVRTIEQTPRGEPINILVTSFNIDMLRNLQSWVTDRIEESPSLTVLEAKASNGSKSEARSILVSQRGQTGVIHFVNRDKFPQKFLGLEFPSGAEREDYPWTSDFETKVRDLHGKGLLSNPESWFLKPDFLLEELERVIFSTGIESLEEYLEVRRRGRVKQLDHASREQVWSVLMTNPVPRSFVRRRYESFVLHRSAIDEGGQLNFEESFTHVFCDECQDFTEAEFRLLAAFPPDAGRLVAAGDEAQSIHLGSSYFRPGSLRGRNWKIHRLEGSYRLPLRIAEAVAPIARGIAETRQDRQGDVDSLIPDTRKSAVLGPRPIVIDGASGEPEREIARLVSTYREFLLEAPHHKPTVSLAEGIWSAQSGIKENLIQEYLPWADVKSERMRKIKGCERDVVVISDQSDYLKFADPELFYTALTRTRGLLILCVSGDSPEEVRGWWGRFDPNRLMFSTERAREVFMEHRESAFRQRKEQR
ncbi:MAG: UvrD-helicase domain-containing protein [Verrucomicrobiota bacterium]